MDDQLTHAAIRLVIAATAGGAIGLERAYNGRAAGFRTHILVCIASALLMLLLDFQWLNSSSERLDSIRIDPTRMAQGIMTGIGFLGAGVILHNSNSVRGLTTAASIWITAAIGIILGSGHFAIGAFACVLVLITLSLFRILEQHIPSRQYARLSIMASQNLEQMEPIIRALMRDQGIVGNGFAYEYRANGGELELETTISAFNSEKFAQLKQALLNTNGFQAFKITPLDN